MSEDDKALVERLRQQGNWYVDNAYNLPLRAADRIEQLTAEVERLRVALQGMVAIQDVMETEGACDLDQIKPAVETARAALEGKQ